MRTLCIVLGLTGALVALPGLATYSEDPNDAVAEAAAQAALENLGPQQGGVPVLAQPGLSLAGEVTGIVGVRSGLSAKVTPLKAAMEALDARVADTLIEVALSSDVLFDFDSDRLKPEAEDSLHDLQTLIREAEVLTVTIIGHTDSKGSDGYNLDLSRRRADSVRAWLVTAGLASDLFSVDGRGEAEPVAPNQRADGSDDPEGRALNRRVEILIRTRQPLS